MATTVITLPAAPARAWSWAGDSRPTVTLGSVSRRLSSLTLESHYQRLTVDGGDLPIEWEVYAEALTLRQGNTQVVIPGPAAPGLLLITDSGSPYAWYVTTSVSYTGLDFSQQVDLVFDDGLAPETFVEVDAGEPAVTARLAAPQFGARAATGRPSGSLSLTASRLDLVRLTASVEAGVPDAAAQLRGPPLAANAVAGAPIGAAFLEPVILQPTSLLQLQREATAVTISWEAPESETIVGYQVQVDGGEWRATGSPRTEYRIVGLEQETFYRVVVRAVSASQNGRPSDVIRVQTVESQIPTVPRFLTVRVTGPRRVSVSVIRPERPRGAETSISYEFSIQDETGTWSAWEPVDTDSDGNHSE